MRLLPLSTASEGAPAGRRWERVLSPVERLSEILFGLIMVLSITGSLSIAESDRGDVRQMLVAALGCNTAWGIVDAVMYLMTALLERHRGRSLLAALRSEPDPLRAHRVIAGELPPLVARSIPGTALEHLRQELLAVSEPPRAGLTRRDLAGALGVFLLVFVSTLPVVVPFLLPLEPRRALRLSNAVALVLLFLVGYRVGKYVGDRPLAVGFSMVATGVVLVAVTMALGG
jgi:hypothetical protein